ncbi:MAG: hypothetical protein DCF16_02140 [Alphaproteobacteria bacterium]|nr:MAG: hypothetical protein DCF16_02140 [Alphaproteobacteria bacterium]
MDINTIINLILLYAAAFMVGWGIILVLLWIRPEYMFLLFYVAANHVLVFLIFDVWRLTWTDAPTYALNSAIAAGIALAWGVPVVALFKWLKTRKTGAEREAEREIARIRAEIAARDAQ